MPRLSSYKIIIFLFALALFLIPKTIFADWSTHRFDYLHSASVPYSIDEPPSIKWSTKIIGSLGIYPTVDIEGNIYLGIINRGIVSLDKNGAFRWSFGTFNPSVSSAIDDGNNIYYSTSGCNPKVYSLDINGNKIWEYDLRRGGGVCGSNTSNGPVALSKDKKTLYVGVDDPLKSLLAFNLDGSLKWEIKINQDITGSSIAISEDDIIYVGTKNARLFSISPNGLINWQKVVAGGGGFNVWAKEPLIGPNGNIFVVTLGVPGGDSLVSYDPLGNRIWSYKVPGIFVSAPAIKDSVIYLPEKNNLHAIDSSNGNFLWKWTAPESTNLTSPVIDSNGNIYTTTSGKVYAISPDGNSLWNLVVGQGLGPLIISNDGLIYTYNNIRGEGTIFALTANVKPKDPEPFLDLPWDYEGKGLTFNEAALNINAYFDHEYPLLSSGMGEPGETIGRIINYLGPPRIDEPYSSHDGYDYGRQAKVHLNDPVLAAAVGTATYVNSCGACGNMILIDHHNGYQTRYLHMQKDGLITNTPGQEVEVSAGEPIGKVGATGNVSPPGDAGSHIHFGVFEDKNGDGSFDDNIPDGAIDPFGWQSKELDPWESFSFFYGGQQRSGNRSYYLWKKKIDNLDATLTPNGGVFKTERYTLDFPEGITDENLKLDIKSNPIIDISDLLSSAGSTIIVTATDLFGNLVTEFQDPFSIIVDFASLDLSRFKTDTMSFYSSEDGVSWEKEETQVDFAARTATTEVDHMSYFALVGERIDTVAPITTPILEGLQGQEGWFRSDVKVILNPDDNEGGLGVDYTMYRKEGEDWEIYSEPLIFTGEGHYRVEFYSADNDENLEEILSVEFNIDKTPPNVSIDVNPQELWPPDGKMEEIKVIGNATDEHLFNSKILVDDEYDLIELETNELETIIELEARREGGDEDGRMYIIRIIGEDLAGNISEGQIEVIVPHDQRKEEK